MRNSKRFVAGMLAALTFVASVPVSSVNTSTSSESSSDDCTFTRKRV